MNDFEWSNDRSSLVITEEEAMDHVATDYIKWLKN